jgi:hypothetical protein
METRRKNRPVSMTIASGPLALYTRLAGTRSAKPSARDPPSPHRRSYQCDQHGLRRACHR